VVFNVLKLFKRNIVKNVIVFEIRVIIVFFDKRIALYNSRMAARCGCIPHISIGFPSLYRVVYRTVVFKQYIYTVHVSDMSNVYHNSVQSVTCGKKNFQKTTLETTNITRLLFSFHHPNIVSIHNNHCSGPISIEHIDIVSKKGRYH